VTSLAKLFRATAFRLTLAILGLSAVGAGLVSIGIPKDSVIKYEVALKSDKFLLIVHGTQDAVYAARIILDGTDCESQDFHFQPLLASQV